MSDWSNWLTALKRTTRVRGTFVQRVLSNGWDTDYAKVTQGPDSGIYTSFRQAEGRCD